MNKESIPGRDVNTTSFKWIVVEGGIVSYRQQRAGVEAEGEQKGAEASLETGNDKGDALLREELLRHGDAQPGPTEL